MQLTQRSLQIGVFVVVILTAFLAAVNRAITYGVTTDVIGPSTGTVLASVLLVTFLRGWEPARYLLVLVLTIGLSTGLPQSTLAQFAVPLFLAPVVAMTMAGPVWVVVAAALGYGLVLARAGTASLYAEPGIIISYVSVVVGMLLARKALDVARAAADANARAASEALLRAERQAAELERQTTTLQEQNSRQQRLLDLVAVLETPTIVLAEGVLLAPLVGTLDDDRAARLTERLLRAVADRRARLVVLDIAGVPVMDSAAAQVLAQTALALRLLGCRVVVTGITAQVALTLTALGGLLADVPTARSPQEALEMFEVMRDA
ncbi:MAG TPA: STAS domain-containing protein [Roseiflexaceae bacterium]|nr:STAS domain-containing protein [Roseiflexaceae bacterium]